MSAKSSGTTSMATISAPASSARWASSGPEASSASRRDTEVETVRTTVRTARSLRAHPLAAASAGLSQQLHGLDGHPALEALDHVVDGQGGDRGGGHRLHLDAGAGGDARGGGQRDGAGVGVELRIDVDVVEADA